MEGRGGGEAQEVTDPQKITFKKIILSKNVPE
jgi:hypothetical protein